MTLITGVCDADHAGTDGLWIAQGILVDAFEVRGKRSRDIYDIVSAFDILKTAIIYLGGPP